MTWRARAFGLLPPNHPRPGSRGDLDDPHSLRSWVSDAWPCIRMTRWITEMGLRTYLFIFAIVRARFARAHSPTGAVSALSPYLPLPCLTFISSSTPYLHQTHHPSARHHSLDIYIRSCCSYSASSLVSGSKYYQPPITW
jgi:hypothetical protein